MQVNVLIFVTVHFWLYVFHSCDGEAEFSATISLLQSSET